MQATVHMLTNMKGYIEVYEQELAARETAATPEDAEVAGQQIRDAVANLRIAKVLNGYRGQAGADMDGLIAAVSAVQDYVIANAGTVEEVEINPLIVTSERAIAVDALIRRAT